MSPTEILKPVDEGLISALKAACQDVGSRATDRLARAHDASHYQLTPRAVAIAHDAAEVGRVFATAKSHGVPVALRSGGTSLSGQAGTDGILVDTRKHFRRIDVVGRGELVRVQPGATVRAVNARLSRFGRKLGPDPASEIACTIGGVVANNSSGMSCGTHANTYQTLESVVLTLASGTVIDTGASDADQKLREHEPAIHAGLQTLRERIRGNSDSVATLQRLHAIKNTMGYGLNSFLDHSTSVDILEHLVVGSEGTLAFVAEATFRTLPVHSHLATGLLIFTTLADATAALPALIESGLATIELMDAASLKVAQRDPEATPELNQLLVADHAALLVEVQEDSESALRERLMSVSAAISRLDIVSGRDLTSDAQTRAQLWHIRKGLFTAVAGSRPSGTTALLEDIAVPVKRLNRTCARLMELFDQYGYEGSVIFGHAKDGNIHFLINERFDGIDKLARYEAFTEDMVDLVLGQGGTLKAEHGTGRIMAPFVERQYGSELYEVMWEIKRLLDPDALLNPGVLLTADPRGHTKNLKVSATVEVEVDRCVECGYCEPVCPSRDLTLTPRERIVLRREIQRAHDNGDLNLARTLEQEYDYDAVQTCAVDGMCQTACPVLINTGDLVRRLRAENQNSLISSGWTAAAKHWDAVSSMGGMALSAAKALPAPFPKAATTITRALLGSDVVPAYSAELPGGGSKRNVFDDDAPVAVYFSSCTTTMFGAVGDDGVAAAFRRLCDHSGIALRTPRDIPSLCCGTPWKSKGLNEGYALMKSKVIASLWEASEGGQLPIVCDASSCTEGLHLMLEAAESADFRIIDAVDFVASKVLPRLGSLDRLPSMTLHPTCSAIRLGLTTALERVAGAAAEEVIVPEGWGCCAFAGDRGMLHPELTASATAMEASEVNAGSSSDHASLNRTCELGMTRATGEPYRHVLQVLDDVVRGTGEAR